MGAGLRYTPASMNTSATGSRVRIPTLAAVVLAAFAVGCSAVSSSLTGRLAGGLATAMLSQNDPETVREGAPAFLLMIDGFLAESPDDPELLMTAARLYSSYTGAFVNDPARARVLSVKGREYGWQALCLSNRRLCGAWERPYEEFEEMIDALGPGDVAAAYTAAASWATWIQVNREDWSAVADKARVEALMERVVTLDASFRDGAPHLYLGVLSTLLPEALGGQPERGREHFERSIELSGGRDLMAKVLLARDYARLVFDRELHDGLLEEVMAADPEAGTLTLSNVLAQQEARRLLAESADYFGE